MKLLINILLLSIIFLCGCSDTSQKINRYNGFGETVSLRNSKVEVPPVLLYPRNLFFLKIN